MPVIQNRQLRLSFEGVLIFLLIGFFLFGQGSPFINPKNFPGDGWKVNDTILPSHINCNPRQLVWRRQWHPTPVLLPGKSR